MSLVFIDGFDHYNFIRAKWQVSGSLDNPTFVAGRFGGQAIKKQFQNAMQSQRRNLGTQTEIFFGCAFNAPGFPLTFSESMFRLEDAGGTVRMSIALTPSGKLSITAGGFINTSTIGLSTGQYHYIECHYLPKDAAGKGGVAEVLLDGVQVANIDGASFPTTTGADDDIEIFGFMDDGTNSPRYLFDDLYILNAEGTSNNSYLGDVRITTMFAALDGDRNEWSPKTDGLPNYQEVDETLLDSNTSYVESGLIGAAEDYDNENFASKQVAPGQIFGVQVANATLRTATGSIEFKNEMVVAGVRFSDEIEYNPGNAAFCVNTYVRDTDPSDGLTWTEDKVSAVNSGIVITAKECT